MKYILAILFIHSTALGQVVGGPVYPIIFIHGLYGSYDSFYNQNSEVPDGFIPELLELLNINEPKVLHICLNHDNNNETANLEDDFSVVGWTNFGENTLSTPNDEDKLFILNLNDDTFQNVNNHGEHNSSNNAAIYKQGKAVSKIIEDVRIFTGSDKVILVGHSMGGLAIREYLQRIEDGSSRWWVVQDSDDGHKVANVVTIGTPHLGSNAGCDPTFRESYDEGWDDIFGTSEAFRDLKYSYDSYSNECEGDPIGIYLFGGNESCIIEDEWGGSTFRNVDINCNGIESDDILGLNQSTTYNSQMPLPNNIQYTWITSNTNSGENPACINWLAFPCAGFCFGDNGNGDGAVLLNNQWLHIDSLSMPVSVSDTLLTYTPHNEEGGDFNAIIRGLDEPDGINGAYQIEFETTYTGFITYQPYFQMLDEDYYHLVLNGTGDLSVTIDGSLQTGITNLSILNSFGNLINGASIETLPFSIEAFDLQPGDYYINIGGSASTTTWQNPYGFQILFTQYGCTDPTALNYDPDATEPCNGDNSCCEYEGEDGLVAYYPFNGNANDESGNGNDGTQYGGVDFTINDRFGSNSSAAYFDGNNDKIQIAHNEMMWGENITISTWVNFSDFNGTQCLLEAWNPSGYGINMFQYSGNNDFTFQMKINGIGFQTNIDAEPYTTNTWHHFLETYDGLSLKVYIDNILVGQTEHTGTFGAPSGNFILGNDITYHNRFFHGLIDDIKIYNYALNVYEISDLYCENGWCDEPVYGCTDPEAINFDPESNFNDDSCVYPYGTVIDIDNNEYSTINIGDQEWMAENLRVTKYKNGADIPTDYSNAQWVNLYTGGYSAYNNSSEESEIYGLLYNWFVVEDNQGICPEGWTVPTDEQFQELEIQLGLSPSEAMSTGWRGSTEGGKLKSAGTIENGDGLWLHPNTNATNDFWYSAHPAGHRHHETGQYGAMGIHSNFWTSDEYSEFSAIYRQLMYDRSTIYRNDHEKPVGYSIRCIKIEDNIVFGCTDPSALNFNPDANFDDDSCEYESTSSFGDINLDGQTDVVDVVYLVDIILNDLNYNSSGDFNNDGVNNVVDIVALVDIILNPSSVGCTDPDAVNYNPDAYYDDGNCEYNNGTCTDIDGNVYSTVQIGTQLWMAENLVVTHYNNGDDIPTNFTNSQWRILSSGAFAIYPWDEDEASQNTCGVDCADVYGNLYNWWAVDDARDICPEGWHVPTDEEWMELEMALGMSYEEAHNTEYRGTDQGSQLAGNADLWNDGALQNNAEFGTSGFHALPGGTRDGNGPYRHMGNDGEFRTSSVYNSFNAWYRVLDYNNSDVHRGTGNKLNGFSVRCVGD